MRLWELRTPMDCRLATGKLDRGRKGYMPSIGAGSRKGRIRNGVDLACLGAVRIWTWRCAVLRSTSGTFLFRERARKSLVRIRLTNPRVVAIGVRAFFTRLWMTV